MIIRDSRGLKIKVGEFVRMKFEYDYNSCNWGYVADFELVKYTSSRKKTYYSLESVAKEKDGEPIISFDIKNNNVVGLYSLKIYKPCTTVKNCTGNEDWFGNDNESIHRLFKLKGN